MNSDDERLELIRCCIDGTASEADQNALQSMLRQDPTARRLFARYANLDAALGSGSIALAVPAAKPERAQPRGLSWRPLWATAAGLVVGVFSASMVWAYAIPSRAVTTKRVVAVLSEGFEKANTTLLNGFPRMANEWSGDMAWVTDAEAAVQPMEGKHMVRMAHKPARKLAYAWRIIDLADYPVITQSESRRLEVSASFDTPSFQRPLRYQIRLAAFSEAPAEIRNIWNNEPLLFDTVLQHVGRNVQVKPGERGWHRVEAAVEIPPGTRSVVISLAAGETDPDQPLLNHYLDDVQARLVITPAPVE